jgi:putative transposase
MPRRRRVCPAGVIFHVVNRAAKRARLFEDFADYASFEQVLATALQRFDIALFAYCVMPNHWHFVLSTRQDGALPRFMHWLTTTHARRWQQFRGLDGQGAVYQGRYRAIPVGPDRYLWVCRYVERNALRANLVARAEDWPWSSLYRRLAPDISWLSTSPVPFPDDWVAHVNLPQTDGELVAFRSALRWGQPFTADVYRDALAAMVGVKPRGTPGRRRRQPRSVLEK